MEEKEKIVSRVIKNYESFLDKKEKIDEINLDYKDLITFVTTKFPKDKFKDLNLDNYCIGKGNDNSFSYLLERGTEKLGNIRGATSKKFGVYYSQKEGGYIYINKFKDKDDAIKQITDSINIIANSDDINNVESDEILSHMFKYKIFYIYNSEKLIPIFSENLLKNSYENLGFKYIDYKETQNELLEIFNKVSNENKTTLNFMYFLLSRYSFENIIGNVRTKLNISVEQIYNILISLTINNLLIFSGPSGIGKTSIVKEISDNLDGNFFKLPIRSNFSDESAILGYWNPLLSKYEGTEVLKFLIESCKKSDSLYFLLLDEMNLSKVENYFSTFLSEIDNLKTGEEFEITLFETQITTKKQYENIKYFLEIYFKNDFGKFIKFGNLEEDFEEYYKKIKFNKDNGIIEKDDIRNIRVFLLLSKNLKIIGTINEDETTQVISNKVLDRSQFISFEIVDLFGITEGDIIDDKLLNRNFYELLDNNEELSKLLEQGNKLFGEDNFSKLKERLNNLNKEMQNINLNESIGYRALEEILNYIKNYMGGEQSNFDKVFDNQIAQKVFPKLKAFSILQKKQKDAFKKIGEIIPLNDFKKSQKMYEHLKNNSDLDD